MRSPIECTEFFLFQSVLMTCVHVKGNKLQLNGWAYDFLKKSDSSVYLAEASQKFQSLLRNKFNLVSFSFEKKLLIVLQILFNSIGGGLRGSVHLQYLSIIHYVDVPP